LQVYPAFSRAWWLQLVGTLLVGGVLVLLALLT
jgi:hypothetical protein